MKSRQEKNKQEDTRNNEEELEDNTLSTLDELFHNSVSNALMNPFEKAVWL